MLNYCVFFVGFVFLYISMGQKMLDTFEIKVKKNSQFNPLMRIVCACCDLLQKLSTLDFKNTVFLCTELLHLE